MNAIQLTKEDGTRFFVTVNSISAVEEVKTRKGYYTVIFIKDVKTMVVEAYDIVLDKIFGIRQMSNTSFNL